MPKGTTVIQAAHKAGSEVPFYCYHPGLSIAGNCRICLVEIEGVPKLQIACNTPATDGMVVYTQNAKVRKARQDVLEFLLVNHPLDCPVCDQAGECWLQDYYMQHGQYQARMDENKVKKTKKATHIGKEVMLDQERCILCSRCVRFCDEITGTGELGIFNRGDHSEINVYPGKLLESGYSGNVVDICPVGALTDKDFRFQTRVWYLASTDSVCPGCSRGCNIQVHTKKDVDRHAFKAQGRRVIRLKPRTNPLVNRWWICDEGRYGYRFVDEGRLSALKQGTWAENLQQLAERIKEVKNKGSIVGLLSPGQTNENLFAMKKLFEGASAKTLCVSHTAAGEGDNLLKTPDKNPNRAGAEALGLTVIATNQLQGALCNRDIELLWVCGQDIARILGEELFSELRKRMRWMVYQGSNQNVTSAAADQVLPSTVYVENQGSFTNVDGRVQRLWQALRPLGEARPDWHTAADLAARLELKGFEWQSEEMIFENLAEKVPFFSGMSYEALGTGGLLGKTAALSS